MNGRRRALALGSGLALAPLLPWPAAVAATATRELHGALDAWAEPGLALGWAIVRGRTEAETQVLLRIEGDPQRHARVSVRGLDPFGSGEVELLAPSANPGVLELRVPRPRLSDHPRTELRFFAPGQAQPGLMVYFLGLPDTTPESATEAQARDGLQQRLARARASAR